MPAEHEIETPPGVAAIGCKDAGRGHDLSYSCVSLSTTINAELAEFAETKRRTRKHERHEKHKNTKHENMFIGRGRSLTGPRGTA